MASGNQFFKGFGVLSKDKGKSLLEEIKENRKAWTKRVIGVNRY